MGRKDKDKDKDKDDLPERQVVTTQYDAPLGQLSEQIKALTKEHERVANARLKYLASKGLGRVRAYVRKSERGDDRQVNSIQVQAELIIEHCIRKGLVKDPAEIQWYRDAESATHYELEQRESGAALMMDSVAGDHIVVLRWDRAFRQVEDGLRTIKTLKGRGVTFHLIDFDGLSLDTSNPTHEFILTIIGAAARLESAMKSQRVRDTSAFLRAAAPDRSTGGLPPYGWKHITRPIRKGLKGAASKAVQGSTSEKVRFGRFLVPDHEERAMIRWMKAELMDKRGMGYRQIEVFCARCNKNTIFASQQGAPQPARWTRCHGRPWQKSTLHEAFKAIAVDFDHRAAIAASIEEGAPHPPAHPEADPSEQSTPRTTQSPPTNPDVA